MVDRVEAERAALVFARLHVEPHEHALVMLQVVERVAQEHRGRHIRRSLAARPQLRVSGEVVHVPLVMGAVVPAYNVPGNPELRFTGAVLADIYLKDPSVQKWNAKRIADLNDVDFVQIRK